MQNINNFANIFSLISCCNVTNFLTALNTKSIQRIYKMVLVYNCVKIDNGVLRMIY